LFCVFLLLAVTGLQNFDRIRGNNLLYTLTIVVNLDNFSFEKEFSGFCGNRT